MGILYQAEHVPLGRKVTLKLLAPRFAADERRGRGLGKHVQQDDAAGAGVREDARDYCPRPGRVES